MLDRPWNHSAEFLGHLHHKVLCGSVIMIDVEDNDEALLEL